MSTLFFISDLHLGHKSAIVWSKDYREGSTIEEHDQILIDKINSIVHKRDTLYILGDVTFKDNKLHMLHQLACRDLRLVRGNHDVLPLTEYLKYFKEVYGIHKKHNMWLTHAPIHPQELRECINVHGHTHSNNITVADCNGDFQYDRRYVNVSVESLNGYPISLEEIRSGAYWDLKVE